MRLVTKSSSLLDNFSINSKYASSSRQLFVPVELAETKLVLHMNFSNKFSSKTRVPQGLEFFKSFFRICLRGNGNHVFRHLESVIFTQIVVPALPPVHAVANSKLNQGVDLNIVWNLQTENETVI